MTTPNPTEPQPEEEVSSRPERTAPPHRLGGVRLVGYALARKEVRRLVGAPAVAAVIVFGLTLWRADTIAGDAGYRDLYGTLAQVIATILVALALEARAIPLADANAARFVVFVTLTYVALGLAAAVIGLDPDLPGRAYRPLLALSLGTGTGALLSVLAIAYRIVDDHFLRV